MSDLRIQIPKRPLFLHRAPCSAQRPRAGFDGPILLPGGWAQRGQQELAV